MSKSYKRTIDQYRKMATKTDCFKYLSYVTSSNNELDLLSSIELIRSLHNANHVSKIVSAFFTTCHLDITASSPQPAHPFGPPLKKKILDCFHQFDAARAYDTNCSLLDSHVFDQDYLQLLPYTEMDVTLVSSLIGRHFAMLGSENVENVLCVTPTSSCYFIMSLFRATDVACQQLGQAGNLALFMTGMILEFELNRQLNDHFAEILPSTAHSGLNVIKVKTEVYLAKVFEISVQFSFCSDNFIPDVQFIMTEAGKFLQSYDFTSIDFAKFAKYVDDQECLHSDSKSNMQIFASVMYRWLSDQRPTEESKEAQRVYWNVWENLSKSNIDEILKNGQGEVIGLCEKIANSITLSKVLQIRPIRSPNRLAANKTDINEDATVDFDNALDDLTQDISERKYLSQNSPVICVKQANGYSVKHFLEGLQK